MNCRLRFAVTEIFQKHKSPEFLRLRFQEACDVSWDTPCFSLCDPEVFCAFAIRIKYSSESNRTAVRFRLTEKDNKR